MRSSMFQWRIEVNYLVLDAELMMDRLDQLATLH